MKKSLIALAVASAFAAPAFAATGNVDVYGSIRMAIQDTDANGVDMDVVDQVSRIGFKGSEDLGGGLKAIWQIEQQMDAASGNNTAFGGSGLRNTFVGLSGDFGTFVMGRHDTPYKMGTGSLDIFADTIGDYNSATLDGTGMVDAAQDARASNAVAYISPTWNGFHFAAAVVPSMDQLNNNDTIDATSATAVYANGPLFASLSYQGVEAVNSDAWKLGVSYAFGDLTVGALYENVDYGVAGDRDTWLLNAKYAMGPIALKAQYAQADIGATDPDRWVIGADYSMSKRTTAYVIWGHGDNDAGTDVSGWNLGLRHDF